MNGNEEENSEDETVTQKAAKVEVEPQQLDFLELQNTYKTLKVILSDENTFQHVTKTIFKTIDVSGDGLLEKKEI